MRTEPLYRRLVLFLRFNIVGVAATATYLVAGMALGKLAHISEVSVHVCAFLISVLVSYAGHARFVFRRTGPVYAFRFAMATGLLFLVSTGLTYFLSTFVKMNGAHIVFIVTVVYPLASFISHSAWTFRDIDAQGKRAGPGE